MILRYTPLARQDLHEIEDHIINGLANPQAAKNTIIIYSLEHNISIVKTDIKLGEYNLEVFCNIRDENKEKTDNS